MRNAIAVLIALATLAGAPAWAQYPSKPVRVIVPYGAGSAPDVIARGVSQRLSEVLGQPFVVDNRVGAGGNIGIGMLARAAPDGYTIGVGTSSSHAANLFLYQSLPFDPVKDFAPISLVASVPSLFVASLSVPARNAQEIASLARAKPGSISYASGGVGSLAHLSGEAFRALSGIDVIHVPFKSAPEIVTSLLSNNVAYGFPTFPTAYPQVKAGKLRALGVTSLKRHPLLPEVPTMLEAYPPGFDLDAWFALFAPAGTPREVVARLHAEIVKMMQDGAFVARFTADGTEVRVSASPDELAAYVRSEIVKWGGIVKASGARLD